MKFCRRATLLLILLLAFGLRGYRLGYQSLWWDEMSTAARALIPLDEMIGNLFTVRNHVPLYFLLMRLWVRTAGDSEFALRFFSLLWGVAGVALTYRLGRQVAEEGVGIVAALLLSISPLHVWYSQEARMYAMLATLATAASILLIGSLRQERWRERISYGVCMLAAIYTHYLALFLLLAHYAFFALNYRSLRRAFLRWIVVGGGVVLLFLPWGAAIMLSGGFARSPIGWIAPAHWYEPLLTLLNFSAGPGSDGLLPAYLALAACMIGITIAVSRSRHTSPSSLPWLSLRLLLCWLAIPILLTWIISLDLPIAQKRSIYMDRYLIPALPSFLLLAAWGLAHTYTRRRQAAIGLLVAVALVNGWSLGRAYFDPRCAREDWRGAVSYLRRERRDEEVVLAYPNHILPLAFYGGGNIPYQVFPPLIPGNQKAEEYLRDKVAPQVEELSTQWRHAWLISSQENTNPHGFARYRNRALSRVEELDVLKGWMDTHYKELSQASFTGVRLTRYDLRTPLTGTTDENSCPRHALTKPPRAQRNADFSVTCGEHTR